MALQEGGPEGWEQEGALLKHKLTRRWVQPQCFYPQMIFNRALTQPAYVPSILFIYLFFIIYFLQRKTERERGKGREREGDIESKAGSRT